MDRSCRRTQRSRQGIAHADVRELPCGRADRRQPASWCAGVSDDWGIRCEDDGGSRDQQGQGGDDTATWIEMPSLVIHGPRGRLAILLVAVGYRNPIDLGPRRAGETGLVAGGGPQQAKDRNLRCFAFRYWRSAWNRTKENGPHHLRGRSRGALATRAGGVIQPADVLVLSNGAREIAFRHSVKGRAITGGGVWTQ